MEQTNRLLGRHEVERVTSLSKAELYRRVREGEFPRQVRLGGRRVA
ncbi:MAG: AlpA family phage regulatory protein [Myxococcota bacterium]